MVATAPQTVVLAQQQLIRQMDDLEQLMQSPSYMGGDVLSLTVEQPVKVTVKETQTVVVFPVGSTLTRMKSGDCALQHSTVGHATFEWDDRPGFGSFVSSTR